MPIQTRQPALTGQSALSRLSQLAKSTHKILRGRLSKRTGIVSPRACISKNLVCLPLHLPKAIRNASRLFETLIVPYGAKVHGGGACPNAASSELRTHTTQSSPVYHRANAHLALPMSRNELVCLKTAMKSQENSWACQAIDNSNVSPSHRPSFSFTALCWAQSHNANASLL